MGREVTLRCDFCGNPIEVANSKLYLAPVLPGNTTTSFQSKYSHWADACTSCAENLRVKMHQRKPRAANGTRTKSKTKTGKK